MKKRVKREGGRRGKNKCFGRKLVALDLNLPKLMLSTQSSCAPNLTDGFPAPGIRSMMSLEMVMNMTGLLLETMKLST